VPLAEKEEVRGMSSEATAALYGALAGGVIAIVGVALATVGVLVGVLIERRLRENKKVRCVASGWEMTEAEPLGWAACSFEVELFNERPSPTGLRGVCVEFLRDGGQPTVGRLRLPASTEVLGVLNLPPQQWVRMSLHAFFEGQEARSLTDFQRADFVGYFPDGRVFRRKIVERKNFVAGLKKKHASRKNYVPWWRRSIAG